MARKIRRSLEAHRKKMFILWIVALFFLMLVVVLDVVIVYNQVHPVNRAFSEEIDYSKIHFEGLALGDEISQEQMASPVIDADYDYTWHHVSIGVDQNKIINRLGFFTSAPDTNIHNTVVDYRGYPITAASDFVNFFGFTKITNFDHYKYFSYQDDNYLVNITLYDGEIYNVELSRK